jgi:hypothetical protein
VTILRQTHRGAQHFATARHRSWMHMLSFESIQVRLFGWLLALQNCMKRTAAAATYDGGDESNIYIHDETMSFRFEFIGQPVISGMRATKYHGWIRLCAYALPIISLVTMLFPAPVNAASLEPTTLMAWKEYVEAANMRMEQRLTPGKTFLWVDEVPDRLRSVRSGEIVVSAVGPHNPKRVPSGLIHDWVGAVFIAHVTLKDVLGVVSDYARYKDLYKPAVIDSKVIATGEARDRFWMLLLNRSLFLKTAFDADYESCYVHTDDRRGYSVSRTTRIQEIEEYGAPAQRTLHEGEGSGIIWRLFGITRYLERDGGVYIELEAIVLSRDIPASLRWLVDPIVRRVSRGSLSTSLRQTESAVRSRAELANGKAASGGSTAATSGSALRQ